MPKPVAVLLAAAVAGLALAACGSGGSGTTGTTGATASQQGGKSATGKGGSAKGGGAKTGKAGKSQQTGGSGGGGSGGGAAVPPLKVSGGGSAQFRTKGGDNSIQNYGEEAGGSELQEAAEAVHAFYVARAGGEWARACSYLTKKVTAQIMQLASQSPKLQGKGCSVILHALTRPLPSKVVRETTAIDAASLRHGSKYSFLIYRGGEGKVYAMPLQQEGGAWKLTSLAATPLG